MRKCLLTLPQVVICLICIWMTLESAWCRKVWHFYVAYLHSPFRCMWTCKRTKCSVTCWWMMALRYWTGIIPLVTFIYLIIVVCVYTHTRTRTHAHTHTLAHSHTCSRTRAARAHACFAHEINLQLKMHTVGIKFSSIVSVVHVGINEGFVQVDIIGQIARDG